MPTWAEDAISSHSIFEEEGVGVEVVYNPEKQRVEATCPDIPPFSFPARSWYVTKKVWEKGDGKELLQKQLDYIKEYVNE